MSKYIKCLSIIILICIKLHWDWVEKSVAYKKRVKSHEGVTRTNYYEHRFRAAWWRFPIEQLFLNSDSGLKSEAATGGVL